MSIYISPPMRREPGLVRPRVEADDLAVGTDPVASVGVIRLPNGSAVNIRNVADAADITAFATQSNNLWVGSNAGGTLCTSLLLGASTEQFFYVAGAHRFQINGARFLVSLPTLDIAAAIAAPSWGQLVQTAGISAQTWTKFSQDLASASAGANVAGDNVERAGNATLGLTNQGGDLYRYSGIGDAALAGDFFFAKGGAAGMAVLDTQGTVVRLGGVVAGATRPSSIVADPTSTFVFRTSNTDRLTASAAQLLINIPTFRWHNLTVLPTLGQLPDTAADATGELLTTFSQDVSGGGTTITGGGRLDRAGNASGTATNEIGGNYDNRAGAGDTVNGEVAMQDGAGGDGVVVDDLFVQLAKFALFSNGGGAEVVTMTGNITLDEDSAHFQSLDPNGVNRLATADAAVETVGGFYVVRNAGAANSVTFRDSTPANIVALDSGEMAIVVWATDDGTGGAGWVAFGPFA